MGKAAAAARGREEEGALHIISRSGGGSKP